MAPCRHARNGVPSAVKAGNVPKRSAVWRRNTVRACASRPISSRSYQHQLKSQPCPDSTPAYVRCNSNRWETGHASDHADRTVSSVATRLDCTPRFDAKFKFLDVKPDYSSTFIVFASTLLFELGLQCAAAAASEEVKYNPAAGEDFLKNASGVAYILLVTYFAYRVLTKRADRARKERLAGSGQSAESNSSDTEAAVTPAPPPGGKVTALSAFLGAAQCSLIAVALFFFSSKLQDALYIQDLPAQYTARNITVTLRTVVTGLCYLATFVFGANAVGLTGLTVQLLLFPDTVKEDTTSRPDLTTPQLPKVSVASKPEEIRRAFEMAEKLGQKELNKKE